ncbi:MAG: MATE family efflux transporter [Gammaproteobacteria bacterium]|nr:MATE family efflux transporter [Gammaproteobacteria bacterium]MDE0368299.1 MATE family efflux transporter [Gammaproteobacteria bacterium]
MDDPDSSRQPEGAEALKQEEEPRPFVSPGIWQLAFPSILGNLSYSVVAMVQTKFVGELGPGALAAVGAGQRVFFAMQAILMAVSAGTTALVARAWGAGDYQEASRVTMASLALAGVFSLAVMVVGVLYARPVSSMFGLDPVTLDLAAENIRMLSWFNLAFAVTFILSAALRASGDAWSPLWIGTAVNLINIPLLYAFVFGRYGFPELGVAGAAAAAGVSFSVGGVLLLGLWVMQKFRIRHVTGGWWRRERLQRLLHIGYPAAFEQVVFQFGFFVFMILIGNFYGTEAFAAYNVGANLLMVCFMVGFGFSIAGSTLVGQHLGADDHSGAERSGWRAGGLAMLSMGALALPVILFATELANLFIGDEPLTVGYTVQFIYVMGAMMPLLAIEFAIGGALRGAGDTRFPLVATFVGLIVVRCGLAAAFTWMELPVGWVFAALVGDYLVKGVMLVARFKRGRWKTVVRTESQGFGRA